MVKRILFMLVVLLVLAGGSYGAWSWFQVRDPMAMAGQLLAAQNPADAQRALRLILRADSRNVQAHMMLAQAHMMVADWVSAEKEVKIGRSLRYDRATVNAMLARTYLMQQKYNDILADIPPIAATTAEQVSNLVWRSRAYVGLNDRVLAQASLNNAAQQAPDDFNVQVQTARMALLKNDPAAAETSIDAALAQQPNDVDALSVRSGVLVERRDLAGALLALNKAVELAPTSPDLRLARAKLLISLDADKGALTDLNVVFDVTPHDMTAVYYNALLMLRAKQYADASVEFEKLAPILDQYPRAYYYRAIAFLETGHLESALESLDRFLKARPGDSDGLRLAAQTEIRAQRPERAVTILLPAARPGSTDAAALDLLGRAYFMLGRMTDAIESFRRANVLLPENRDFAAHLAAARTRFGEAPLPPDANDGLVQ